MNTKRLLLFPVILQLVGCATMSNKDKTLALMGAAGIAGSLIGSASSPESDNAAAHAMLWGGVAAAGAGVVGLYVYDDAKEVREREQQIATLQKEIAIARGEDTSAAVRVVESNALFEAKIPKEIRPLVRPGRWSLYKLDRWTMDGDNQIIHQDKMFKLEPPQINVGSNK